MNIEKSTAFTYQAKQGVKPEISLGHLGVRVILKKNLTEEEIANPNIYSIECGYADDERHFDHHGENFMYDCPCNNKELVNILNKPKTGITVILSHIDADCFTALSQMLLGTKSRDLDLDLLESLDMKGTSILKDDKFNTTLLYFIGVGALSRNLKVPRVTDEAQDITSIVEVMLNKSVEDIIEIGRETQEEAEKAYSECFVTLKSGVTLINQKNGFSVDPSRGYEDGAKVVVLYRECWKTVSVYAAPNNDLTFKGKTIAGINFDGQPKACGSPRGETFTFEDAERVFQELIN